MAQGSIEATRRAWLVTALADQAQLDGHTREKVEGFCPAAWVYLRSRAGQGYGPEPDQALKAQVIVVLRDREANPDPTSGFPAA
jgi:hypothetical protein